MNTSTVLSSPKKVIWSSAKMLRISARIWFGVAIIGFLLFATYIIAFYAGTTLNGNIEAWNEVSIKGYIKGDLMGNLFFISHIAMAAIICFGGIIQVIPQIRKWSLKLHRWNGRLYILSAFMAGLGGLYLVWVRQSTLSMWGSVAITLNTCLIIVFGAIAWRLARNHDAQLHRRWALRTFIVTSGVWFFRIGMMAWIIINQGPVGSTDNLDGPFDKFWGFANYLMPLLIMEIYFRVEHGNSGMAKYLMSGFLILASLVTCVGIFGATMFMWYPAI